MLEKMHSDANKKCDAKIIPTNFQPKTIALTCAYLYNPNLNRIFERQIHTNYYYNTL